MLNEYQLPIETIELKPTAWLNWCRLCGKEDADDEDSVPHQYDSFDQDQKIMHELKNIVSNASLTEALEKFFNIKVTREDLMPNSLCTDCLCVVSNTIAYSDHVLRVQKIYSYLIHEPNSQKALRLKFTDLDTERNHIFSNYRRGVVALEHLTTTKVKKEKLLPNTRTLSFVEEEPEQELQTEEYTLEQEADDEEEQEIDNKYEKSCKLDPFDASLPAAKPFDSGNKIIDQDDDDDDEEDEYENPDDSSYEELPLDVNVGGASSSDDDDDEDKEGKTRAQAKRRQKLKHKVNLKEKSKTIAEKRKEKHMSIKGILHQSLDITCKECNLNITSYELYQEHVKSVHALTIIEKQHKCLECEKIFKSDYCFEKHLTTIHPSKDVRYSHKCEQCEERFASAKKLEIHLKVKHEDDRPYICEECGKRVRTECSLKDHMLCHRDEKAFECKDCNLKYKRKSKLKAHIIDKHSGIEHKCHVCGLILNSRTTLRQHFLVHSEDTPHKCDHCGRSFKRVKTLKEHLIIHTGLKPYTCEFCDCRFANGSSRRAHMKRNHPKELEVYDAAGFKPHANIPSLKHLKEASKAAKHMNFMPKHSPPVRKNALIVPDDILFNRTT